MSGGVTAAAAAWTACARATGVFAQTVQRFPRPDFQSGYTRPVLQTPGPRALPWEYVDVLVLAAALGLATWFALRDRSRVKIFILMLLSLAYFGFFRGGCVCPVGSVQNVGLALFGDGYAIPLVVIAFFALPLIIALFFGRTFCASVCPLGAIQDAVVLRPVAVRPWIAAVLGFIPVLYLGFGVFFASLGAGFIICRFDPFVGFFRFGASFTMIVFGLSFLLLGTVVARPYCRFLCPLGVLLNGASRLSKWHVRISPGECINCRLCEDSCPFGAIRPPMKTIHESRAKRVRRLALLLLLLPVLAGGGGWAVSRLAPVLSRAHFTVALAEEIRDGSGGTIPTDEVEAFRASGMTTDELFEEARAVRERFAFGGWFLGGFLGLVLWMKLVGTGAAIRREEYSIDRGACLSCGRCFSYCPIEKVRRGEMSPDEAAALKRKPNG